MYKKEEKATIEIQAGKLYKCSEYYLLIYLSTDLGPHSAAWVASTATVSTAAWVANFWSGKLNCKVRFSEPNEVFMCLEQTHDFARVLFGEKQGWIILKDRLRIERVL